MTGGRMMGGRMMGGRMMGGGMIRAAGAVVWRGNAADPEIALVHRPAYRDWSLPKGKVRRGEHVIAAALREVREETGLRVVLGRALPPLHYTHRGRIKRVDYWLAHAPGHQEATTGDGHEVDEIAWLPVEEARRRLTYEGDRGLLRALGAGPLVTAPLILLRHALAGSRQEWKGDDDQRPLDEHGLAQAEILATVLGAYRPVTLVSSHSRRCTQTLRPYAERHGLEVRKEKALSESAYDPREAGRIVRELLAEPEPAVLCSHGKVLPELLGMAYRPPYGLGDPTITKGGFAVLHRAMTTPHPPLRVILEFVAEVASEQGKYLS
ncbi:NUDIX hydrolase [Microbispora sp. H11081]|uniref:NUDIX hydrolase n=1 Tax=Microbispora sp. H11081 TaxID=2729107 RepID=UPI0020166C11|nr:NUDIX hydrolase [Microbispora sp. H11081]